MFYIYIFDYPSGFIYEIKVEDIMNKSVETIIEDNGFDLNDINYMCSDVRLGITKIK